ncbi:prepilin-type N-terminal cleavage/methylation domain-containing protein [Cytobacillus gottheilii]|uniref:Prepilin-type N-terminal cleavage/methylation domain-containing protein n=1 Tax=Cytobacillus gottheilii TaxID=859144 RepID=A0ABX8F7Y8_9BACI|nr:prepilin-type N-terminal cleavage/methylation domain-containing protein [Cytobacillus gottheilii]QVY60543.1 prepilin-type N-terminal cleavage/methylation domain-containing protein [Cytobacillus gottheilii]
MFQKLRNTLKNQKGLTLIELLAVIVILGIIAAIAIPSIGGIIKKSENDAKVAEGIQIISAAKMYVTSSNPGAGDLTKTQLEQFLDNVKDTDYTVTLAVTDGKYTYSLKGHDSVALVDSDPKDSVATEKELLDY